MTINRFSVTRISPPRVWRDALGPGYAIGVVEGVVQVAGTAASRPYNTGDVTSRKAA